MSKIGWIGLTFKAETHKAIAEWASQFKGQFFSVDVNGKMEGGDVTNKLHLTLFYGLNEEDLDKSRLAEYLSDIKISDLEVIDVSALDIPQYHAKALILKIRDDGRLRRIHEELKEFPYLTKYQNDEFIPHVTVGFFRNDFDDGSVVYTGPKSLEIDKVKYFSKTHEN